MSASTRRGDDVAERTWESGARAWNDRSGEPLDSLAIDGSAVRTVEGEHEGEQGLARSVPPADASVLPWRMVSRGARDIQP